jgi:hypothetical protein
LKIFDSTLKRMFSILENSKDTFVKEIYKKLKTSFDSKVELKYYLKNFQANCSKRSNLFFVLSFRKIHY